VKFFFLFFLCIAHVGAQLIFTEVMFNLPGKDSPNEFVEIFNTSDTIAFNIGLFEIKDRFARDQLIPLTGNFTIEPLTYALILEGDYILKGGLYDSIIPEGIPCFSVDDLSIGNGLSIADSLYLIDSSGFIHDSIGWDLEFPPGFSYEKVCINNYQEPTGWSIGLDFLGTPGKENSNTPFMVDGEILFIETFYDTIFSQNEPVAFRIVYCNSGLSAINATIVLEENDILLGSSNSISIPPRDTTDIQLYIDSLSSGIHTIQGKILVLNDQDSTNNSQSTTVGIRYKPGVILINEFLPDPGNFDFEFVEFISFSNVSIDLSGWKIKDRRSFSRPVDSLITLVPGQYFIIADDSAALKYVHDSVSLIIMDPGFPALNNSGDDIILVDPFGTIIDSLSYSGGWGIQSSRSLEKVIPHFLSTDSLNWIPALNFPGITPGFYNSVSPRWSDGKIDTSSIHLDPEYPEEDESMDIDMKLINSGEGPMSGNLSGVIEGDTLFTIPVYIKNFLDTILVTVSLPGLTAGSYTISFNLDVPKDTIFNNRCNFDFRVKYPAGVLLFNEFLPVPESDRAEFIELISTRYLDLEHWTYNDLSGSRLTLPHYNIYPGEYFVISNDSSIIGSIPEEAQLYIPKFGFPSLNNESDSIWLSGPAEGGAEALKYDASWGIVKDRSIERIAGDLAAGNNTSWETSVALEGSTPGQENSVMLQKHVENDFGILFKPNPFSPNGDGIDDLLEIQYYTPLATTILTIIIFNLEGLKIVEPYYRVRLPGKGLWVWNGKDSKNRRLPIGIYLIKAVLEDPHSSLYKEFLETVVLARQL